LDGQTPDDLRQRLGSIEQIAGIDRFCEEDGPGRGARRFHVRTGSGLEFDVLPDRGLDLGAARFRGIPLAWISPAGHVAPGLTEQRESQWQRTFGGGLLTTCGLDQFGAADDAEDQPLHGRASALPAHEVNTVHDRTENRFEVTGRVRQSRLFGENLVLSRSIRAEFGSRIITVSDTVTNEGFSTQPHMVLYHMNLGWPLVSRNSTLNIPGSTPVPRDAEAERGASTWDSFTDPEANYAEQVFRHEFADAGPVAATVSNPDVGLALAVRFDTTQLPGLFQWKMLGSGSYVLGIEPANCTIIHGRAAAREAAALPHLEPGETRAYSVSIEAIPLS
jgi:hypothetical protein